MEDAETKDVIAAILTDLYDISDATYKQRTDFIPNAGILYLKANKKLFTSIIDHLYKAITHSERESLFYSHRELDHSAISDSFRPIAMQALTFGEELPELARVTADDIAMLIRAIRFMRYCKFDRWGQPLRRSPIKEYGLKLYRPPESIIQVQELESIDWYIVDSIYADAKQRAFEQCKEVGLELAERRSQPKEYNYERALEFGTKTFLAVLEKRIKYDLAICQLQCANGWRKFIPYITRRYRDEAISVRNILASGLTHLGMEFNDLWRRDQKPSEKQVTLQVLWDLQKFSQTTSDVEENIENVTPNPDVFIQLKSLLPTKEVKYMGDVYQNIQGSTIINRSNVENWNEVSKSLDLRALEKELSDLRIAMKKRAETADQDMAVGRIAAAQQAATENNGPAVLQYIKEAGTWALEVAKDVGAKIAAEIIIGSIKQ